MKTRFHKGQPVESTVDAQGLKKGRRYLVAGVQTMSTPFGTFTTYALLDPETKAELAVNNGHLVLTEAR